MKKLLIVAILANLAVPAFAGDLNFSKAEYKQQRDEFFKLAQNTVYACEGVNSTETKECKEALERLKKAVYENGEYFYCSQC